MLTISQQKEIYDNLYDHIIDLHSLSLKEDLKNFTKDYREKRHKGIVLLSYSSTKDMIDAVKNKTFFYDWIPKNDAVKLKHSAIPNALITMNSKTDCIFVCSLELSAKHFYINCMKFKDIGT